MATKNAQISVSSIYVIYYYREVRGGRRIGLYRVKGELGIGNFSRVKLAQHELTRGNIL